MRVYRYRLKLPADVQAGKARVVVLYEDPRDTSIPRSACAMTKAGKRRSHEKPR